MLQRILTTAVLIIYITGVNAQVIPDGSTATASGSVLLPAFNSAAKINYVRTWEPWKAISSVANVPGETVANVKMTTAYVDGLGRVIETVSKKVTSAQGDLVAFTTFDDYGRPVIKYLPFASDTATGYFCTNPTVEQYNYYHAIFPSDPYSFSKAIPEKSPLGRPDTTHAPGVSWMGTLRGLRNQYLINAASDSVRIWTIPDSINSTPVTSSVYAAGLLYKNVTIDENGNQIIEYTDKEGKVILKKVQLLASPGNGHYGWLCTYYIYDDYGLLRFVVQPNAVEAMAPSSWTLTTTLKDELCFRYDYDERNRMIIKKVPGAGEVYMIYDARDRLVMTQDANLRALNKWTYTTYDAADRPTGSGLLNSSSSRATHQSAAYSSTSYPNLGSFTTEALTETFYDNYTYSGAKSFVTADVAKLDAGSNPNAETTAKSDLVYEMATGTKVKVLGTTSTFLIATMYYDDKGRSCQSISDNVKSGTDVMTSQYDFSGKVLSTYLKHNNPSAPTDTIKVLTKMLYDHAGRLSKVWKKLNDSGSDKAVFENVYDNMGQLISKRLSPDYNSGVGIDTLSYEYNMRGWLTSINKNQASGINNSRWFGEILSYDVGFSSHEFNGNISGIQWRSKGDGEQRAYGFMYDKANRFMKADFTQYTSSSWNNDAALDFTVKNMSYDANGNILSMTQRGVKVSSSYTIDSLVYGYNTSSNRLHYVTDKTNDTTTWLGDFKEYSNTTHQDYSYDDNGNMTLDSNKRIGNIHYNYLNLPDSITVTGKGTIKYTYDASGNKLKKITTEGATTTTTSYISGFVYKNDTLQYFGHEEGRIRKDTSGFLYDYFIKDHLGNIRMVLTEQQQTDAYPPASLESPYIANERLYYARVDTGKIGVSSVSGYPTDTYTSPNDALQKLDGNGPKVGTAMLLKVMSGDKFNLRVSSWWHQPGAGGGMDDGLPSPISALGDLINALGGAITSLNNGLHTESIGFGGSGVLSPGISDFLLHQGHYDGNRPRAALNWILFDEQFKLVTASSGFDQAGGADTFKVHTKTNLTISRNGYLYVFVSNETPTVPVYFDNLQVTHIRGPLLEENHYYPFGLIQFGISSKALNFGDPENKNKYNGIEKENDLSIEIYDAQLRELDGQLGRWWEIDSKIENMEMWSPYISNYDNPIRYSDHLGDEGQDCCWDAIKGFFSDLGDRIVERGLTPIRDFAVSTWNQAGENFRARWAAHADPVHQILENPLSLMLGPAGPELSLTRTAVVSDASVIRSEIQPTINTVNNLVKNESSVVKPSSANSVGSEIIPDHATVVRGGTNTVRQIETGTKTHPSGVTGVSVECGTCSVKELAKSLPHNQIGVTTVGAVRKAGGDVVRTSGKNPNHATLTGLTPEKTSQLLNPVIKKPY